jgi:hypothetical protein
MQAEISLVMSLRRQLCAREDAAAEQAHAEPLQPSPEPRSGAVPRLDYAAYIRCRQQAEALLRRGKPVLYRNGRGFVFYTPAGADLARAADALQPEINQACATASPPSGPSPPRHRRRTPSLNIRHEPAEPAPGGPLKLVSP